MLNEKTIKDALNFYEIKDKVYLNKCLECIKYINSNSNLKNKFENVYNELYFNDEKTRNYWKMKTLNELFGNCYHPFITSILLLIGYKIHIKNMQEKKFDESQITIHKKRVKESLLNDIIDRHYESIRIPQMVWGIYFIKTKIIEVGRLQYELSDYEPINETKQKCIKIHVPKGDKLDIIKVKQSLKESKLLIKKYFNLENYNYYASSWLLSKEIKSVVNDNSNIAKFYDLFDILKEKNGIIDVLNFIFNLNNCNDYKQLEEKTTLQREVKKLLLNDIVINIGIGKLKENE